PPPRMYSARREDRVADDVRSGREHGFVLAIDPGAQERVVGAEVAGAELGPAAVGQDHQARAARLELADTCFLVLGRREPCGSGPGVTGGLAAFTQEVDQA